MNPSTTLFPAREGLQAPTLAPAGGKLSPDVAVLLKNCYIGGQHDCLVYQAKRSRVADVADLLEKSATPFCLVSQAKLVDVADFRVADFFRQPRSDWSEKVYFFCTRCTFWPVRTPETLGPQRIPRARARTDKGFYRGKAAVLVCTSVLFCPSASVGRVLS